MLPIFPLSSVLLPESELQLKIFEQRYKVLLADCIRENSTFGVVFCTNQQQELTSLRNVGCVAEIVDYKPDADGSTLLTVRGVQRFLVGLVEVQQPYFQANGQPLNDMDDMPHDDPLLKSAQALLDVYRELLANVDPSMLNHDLPQRLRPTDAFKLADQLLLTEDKRQTMLELGSMRSRFALATKFLRVEIERLRFLLADDSASARFVVN